MQLETFDVAITHFLEHVVIVSASGTGDAQLRARALATGQKCVNLWWTAFHKMREAQAALEFDADGVADLPDDFLSWDRNFGWIVFPRPNAIKINPTHCNPEEVMAWREIAPDEQGPTQQVVMHGGLLYTWPTKPPSAPWPAQAFYHRIRPELVDDDDPDANADWALIPPGDQLAIVEDLMKSAWEAKDGDVRESEHRKQALKDLAAMYKSRNLDQQPQRFCRPYRTPRMGRVRRLGEP